MNASMFPHTVTVYNVLPDMDTSMATFNITILRGVLLDISKGANVMRSGLENADAARLYIPMNIKAVNALTGQEQQFIGAKEYERLDDVSGYWTLRISDNVSATPCYFVKGEVVEQSSYDDLDNRYDNVFDITSVDLRDFGSKDMWHWEVGGK